jgi:NTE family protein
MEFRGSPGLVLPGGGARAAYQVGVLKAVAAVLESEALPFPAIAGISAGAINATALAQHAGDFPGGVERLERIWTGMHTNDVFEIDVRRLQGLFAGRRRPIALFDNAPLARLLEREIDRGALDRAIESGHLLGLAVTASNYSSGEATSFVQASPAAKFWHHDRRDSVPARIGPEHLLASSALPLLFPAQRVGAEYFVDGSLRMTAPLSPVINLGADRVLVIGVRHEALLDERPDLAPGLGEIGGYTLESIFSENLNADLERMQQINTLLEMVPRWRRNHSGRRRIEVMVIRPSEDVRSIAARFASRLPRSIRLFLRAVGGWGSEWRLPSYLLFDGAFGRALIDLGYRDGLHHRKALESFFS